MKDAGNMHVVDYYYELMRVWLFTSKFMVYHDNFWREADRTDLTVDQ